MSYILDALRRADAERERGSVPGIHAQPAMLGAADNDVRGGPVRSRLWLGLGLGLVVLALLAWWFAGHDAPRPVDAAPAPPPVLAAPAPAPAPLPTTVTAPVTPATPAPAPLAELPRKAPPKLAVATPAKPTAAAVAASKPAVSAQASAPAVSEARVYALSELPDDIRRELPTLTVGGAMHSQNPANRLLIVNGQAFHEGDKLAPGLSLQQIKLKSAVLEYKGYRYGISY